jgi:hypothetical protein
MKKSLIIFSVLCSFLGTTLMAQSSEKDAREYLSLGIKAGLNHSNVWDAKGQDFEADPKFGFAGGAFLGFPIGKLFGFQPEVLISQKGFKGSGTLLGTAFSFSRTTTYVDVPIQLQFKPKAFITLLAGPQYSYLIRQKDVYTFGPNSIAQEEEFKNDNIRKNVLGFVGGLDVNIKHVVVSGRAGLDFQANNGNGTSSTPRYKNRWLQFTVGYKI